MTRPESVRGPGGDRREVLVVEVAGERHGLMAAEVEAVAQAVTIAPLRAPRAGIEGWITYRGQHVPVSDLRTLLGLPRKELEHTDHLVIVAARGRLLAARVDRAVTLASLHVAPLNGPEYASLAGGTVAGVAHTADGPLFVHDLTAVLDDAAPSPRDRP